MRHFLGDTDGGERRVLQPRLEVLSGAKRLRPGRTGPGRPLAVY